MNLVLTYKQVFELSIVFFGLETSIRTSPNFQQIFGQVDSDSSCPIGVVLITSPVKLRTATQAQLRLQKAQQYLSAPFTNVLPLFVAYLNLFDTAITS